MSSQGLRGLENRIHDAGDDPLRREVLRQAKNFKESWIELGRALYTVWKDKLYRGWGFSTFDLYTAKEIGIRKATSLKLLRSYCFLEKEEPGVLRAYSSDPSSTTLPAFESVDLLRKAKNGKVLDDDDYSDFKQKVFNGTETAEAKKELTALIRQRKELDPEEVWEKKRQAQLKRLVSILRSVGDEIQSQKLAPASLARDISSLVQRIESELAR